MNASKTRPYDQSTIKLLICKLTVSYFRRWIKFFYWYTGKRSLTKDCQPIKQERHWHISASFLFDTYRAATSNKGKERACFVLLHFSGHCYFTLKSQILMRTPKNPGFAHFSLSKLIQFKIKLEKRGNLAQQTEVQSWNVSNMHRRRQHWEWMTNRFKKTITKRVCGQNKGFDFKSHMKIRKPANDSGHFKKKIQT